MFESVLEKEAPGSQRALGGGVSVALHAAMVAAAVWAGTRPAPVPEARPVVPTVTIVRSHPTVTLSPAEARPAAKAPPVRKHAPPKPMALVTPRALPRVKPPEVTPPPQPAQAEENVPANAIAGSEDREGDPTSKATALEAGGGGTGGTGGLGGGGTDYLQLTAEMVAPARVEVPEFIWPREALEARVEGLILAQCAVSTAGTLLDCKLIKRLPHIDDALVLEWLARWRMRPALLHEQPVAVRSYSIPIRLRLPTR